MNANANDRRAYRQLCNLWVSWQALWLLTHTRYAARTCVDCDARAQIADRCPTCYWLAGHLDY